MDISTFKLHMTTCSANLFSLCLLVVPNGVNWLTQNGVVLALAHENCHQKCYTCTQYETFAVNSDLCIFPPDSIKMNSQDDREGSGSPDKYRERTTYLGRDYQSYSLEHQINLAPVDDVSYTQPKKARTEIRIRMKNPVCADSMKCCSNCFMIDEILCFQTS